MVQFYSPEHALYKLAKAEKRGETQQPGVLQEVKAWMQQKWGLTVVYIHIEESAPHVLHLIFDTGKDYQRWWKISKGSLFRRSGEKLLSRKYKHLLDTTGDNAMQQKISTQKLAFPSHTFSSVAMQEAQSNIPPEQFAALRAKYMGPEVWELHFPGNDIRVFSFTDQQKAANTGNAEYEQLVKEYYDLLKPHDEFNYFERVEMKLILDSKENFDNRYQSNWYYYYK